MIKACGKYKYHGPLKGYDIQTNSIFQEGIIRIWNRGCEVVKCHDDALCDVYVVKYKELAGAWREGDGYNEIVRRETK
jgi:hypothetical protein